jgi:hypothetical protein
MYKSLILIATMVLCGCSPFSKEDFNLDMGMGDFGVSSLPDLKEHPTPENDIMVVLKGMNKMSLKAWSSMTLRPPRYVDPMLPDMIYITSSKSTWNLEAGPKADNEPYVRHFSRNFTLKPGEFTSFPEQRTLALQWPDETKLYAPSN